MGGLSLELLMAAEASLREGNTSLSEAQPGDYHFNFGQNFRLTMGVNIAGNFQNSRESC
jgi:hypothetical protein